MKERGVRCCVAGAAADIYSMGMSMSSPDTAWEDWPDLPREAAEPDTEGNVGTTHTQTHDYIWPHTHGDREDRGRDLAENNKVELRASAVDTYIYVVYVHICDSQTYMAALR